MTGMNDYGYQITCTKRSSQGTTAVFPCTDSDRIPAIQCSDTPRIVRSDQYETRESEIMTTKTDNRVPLDYAPQTEARDHMKRILSVIRVIVLGVLILLFL